MVGYYSQMQQYQSIMSKEEKNQYNNILNMTEKAGELNVQIENQKNNWLATHKSLQFIKSTIVRDLANNIDKMSLGVQRTTEATNVLTEEF